MKKFILTLMILGISSVLLFGQSAVAEENDSKILDLLNKIEAAEADKGTVHCEVPCGIYGDSLRISLIREHSSTIEKAMNQINKASNAESPNYNQLIRWVNNKEKHAEEIQHIVAQYFMHQRVKIPAKDMNKMEMEKAHAKYYKQLRGLHAIQVYAMKCKQSTDLNQVGNLNTAISEFEEFYFHPHEH